MRQQRAVEKASERIREEVLAMRTSDDLLKVVFSMFREIGNLGVPAVACTFHFVNEEADRIKAYAVADHPGKYGISVPPPLFVDLQSVDIDETEDYSFGEWVVDGDIIGDVSGGGISSFLSLVSSFPADFVERWRAGEVWSHREVASETKYMKRMLGKYPELKEYPFCQDGIVTHVSFPHGTVAIKQKESEHSEEHIAVVQTLTDPELLRRVLMNLLSNAVKFTEEGSITVSVRPADDGIEVSVADTGVGIPAADLPHIFDEFQQVARPGSGEKEGTELGLAIARKSVFLGSIRILQRQNVVFPLIDMDGT